MPTMILIILVRIINQCLQTVMEKWQPTGRLATQMTIYASWWKPQPNTAFMTEMITKDAYVTTLEILTQTVIFNTSIYQMALVSG